MNIFTKTKRKRFAFRRARRRRSFRRAVYQLYSWEFEVQPMLGEVVVNVKCTDGAPVESCAMASRMAQAIRRAALAQLNKERKGKR